MTPVHDRWLDVTEQAELLGVAPSTIPQYIQRYGPDHANPYPAHVDGQHKRFGRSTAVSEQALRAWAKRRTGAGRPRVRPPGLTIPQWRALARLCNGDPITPTMTVALVSARLARHTRDGYVSTAAGRRLIKAYPWED